MTPKDAIAESVMPVLLGSSAEAHLMAWKIYLKFGIRSYICAEKQSLLDAIDPTMRFFSVVSEKNSGVACEALAYLSADKELLPILIPCNSFGDQLVKENKEFLEKRFIITNKTDFFTIKPINLL